MSILVKDSDKEEGFLQVCNDYNLICGAGSDPSEQKLVLHEPCFAWMFDPFREMKGAQWYSIYTWLREDTLSKRQANVFLRYWFALLPERLANACIMAPSLTKKVLRSVGLDGIQWDTGYWNEADDNFDDEDDREEEDPANIVRTPWLSFHIDSTKVSAEEMYALLVFFRLPQEFPSLIWRVVDDMRVGIDGSLSLLYHEFKRGSSGHRLIYTSNFSSKPMNRELAKEWSLKVAWDNLDKDFKKPHFESCQKHFAVSSYFGPPKQPDNKHNLDMYNTDGIWRMFKKIYADVYFKHTGERIKNEND